MSSNNEIKLTIKLLLLGDSSVGKTSILNKYIANKFIENNIATLGVEYMDKTVDYNNFKIKLQIWDTSGEEKYRSITKSYYKNAEGLLVIFDITNEESFNHVKNWINEAKDNNSDIKIILVGNKLDFENERKVTEERAKKFAENNSLQYFETSAKNGKNIHKSFKAMIDLILEGKSEQDILNELKKPQKTVSVNDDKKKKSCC